MDGTLVTQDKVLTATAIRAVRQLHEAEILFAITSGRPPKGMEMLVEPLDLDTPIAAFNGGVLVDRDMRTIDQKVIPHDLVGPVVALMKSFALDVWLYRGADWFVIDPNGPHVDREAWTVKFDPTVVDSYDDVSNHVAKLVGVSDDREAVVVIARSTQEAIVVNLPSLWPDEPPA